MFWKVIVGRRLAGEKCRGGGKGIEGPDMVILGYVQRRVATLFGTNRQRN